MTSKNWLLLNHAPVEIHARFLLNHKKNISIYEKQQLWESVMTNSKQYTIECFVWRF